MADATHEGKGRIYVASSWRNEYQPHVVQTLRQAGFDVYDFRNPREGDNGFSWREIDADWQDWTPAQHRKALSHPVARAGFDSDLDAMKWADACVMVMPCGRSAHLEAGYFVGARKPLVILQVDQAEPDLMYAMADHFLVSFHELDAVCDELQAAIARATGREVSRG